MTNKKNKIRGFTLLEVIIVVIIIAIALGFSVIYYQTSQGRADVNSQASIFISYLRLARSNAQSGLNGAANSVRLQSSSYTFFEGEIFNESDENNETTDLPAAITIQNINLNGGGTDIIFEKSTGETDTYGTLDFVSSNANKTITITISSIGTINYQ